MALSCTSCNALCFLSALSSLSEDSFEDLALAVHYLGAIARCIVNLSRILTKFAIYLGAKFTINTPARDEITSKMTLFLQNSLKPAVFT
jgi:hypothetical protein